MLLTPADLRAIRLIEGCQAVLAAILPAAALWWLTSLWWALAVWLPLAVVIWFWLTRGLRRRLLALQAEMPPAWRSVLLDEVDFFVGLSADEQQRFEALVRVFRAEVPIRGIGCTVDDRHRTLIAAGAIIPIFGFPRWEYEALTRVLVYPDTFSSPLDDHDDGPDALGMVIHDDGILQGLMILSLPDIADGFAGASDKENVVIHEFAHLVDLAAGDIDGYPIGLSTADRPAWDALVEDELHRGLRPESGIPAYGYTNREEFFAVCSEYFFEHPEDLQRRHPELYRLLEAIYRQDTRTLFSRRLPGFRRRRRARLRRRHEHD